MHKHALKIALGFATLAAASSAHAQPGPTGVWADHTGRGAVEITQCGANLCGRIVWLKDAAHKKACGMQVIGNVKPVGKDTWDGGWILDPQKNEKYSVELKPVGPDKLRVVGYMGSKLFSETMTWKRAAADLKRCDDAQPEVTASPGPTDAKAAPPPPAEKAPEAPIKTGKKSPRDATKGKTALQPDRDTGCKKYFPQIGAMVSVPCS